MVAEFVIVEASLEGEREVQGRTGEGDGGEPDPRGAAARGDAGRM